MNSELRHLIFTNFGIGIQDELWLLYRLEIFSNTVLLSLAGQSNKNFHWFIFIDKNLPIAHEARLQRLLQQSGIHFDLIKVSSYALVNRKITEILAEEKVKKLLTSRIDDDDCLHLDAIDLLQDAACKYSKEEELLLISLKNGIEFLPSDNCYRTTEHKTIALGLTLVENSSEIKTKSVTQYAHHMIAETLNKQNQAARHVELTHKDPLYLYTKHPLSDSFFFGARARILSDEKNRKKLHARLFKKYGLTSESLTYLQTLLQNSPIGMPHKYLEKLDTIRKEISQLSKKKKENESIDIDGHAMDRLLAKKNRFERYAVRPNPRRADSGKIRVAILGSCVSRDLFEFQKELFQNFEICFYMARSSVVSYLSLPCLDNKIKIVGEGFEEKRARYDLSKEHWALLDAARPDIILLDFIDERIGLIQHEGSFLSASGPMIKAFERSNGNVMIKRPWSNEIEKLRHWALPVFMERLSLICQNIVVHKACWAEEFKSENKEIESFAKTEFETLISLNNALLQKMFVALDNLSIPVEQIGGLEAGLIAGGDHKWAFCPYHYDKIYYKTLARQFSARVML